MSTPAASAWARMRSWVSSLVLMLNRFVPMQSIVTRGVTLAVPDHASECGSWRQGPAVDTVASGDDLRDAARLARECMVMGRAVALGQWIGTSARRVTAGQVLRKAEVPAAGAALGVLVPPRVRTMADVRALHRPWCVAVATGLLQVGEGKVTGGPALECW